jgi:hypothetical protein
LNFSWIRPRLSYMTSLHRFSTIYSRYVQRLVGERAWANFWETLGHS